MIVFETAPLSTGWQLSRNGETVGVYPSQQDAENAAQRIAETTRNAGNSVRLVLKHQDRTVKHEILLH